MKKIYLPSLNKITVDNYSLYAQCPSFEYVFEEGISANGIGKTTFVNMIIYALVGYKKEERRNKKALNLQDITLQDTNFFKDRMNYNFDGGLNEAASVTLEYSLGSNTLIIQRSLYNDEIQKLIVNYKEVKQRAESDYQNIVNKYSGLTDFEDFRKIISEFLFFDERRKNIAWEIDMQDYLLKVLLFDEEYFNKFKELEEKIVQEDTKGRHKSEDRKVVQASIDELIREKEQVINNLKEEFNGEINVNKNIEEIKIKKNSIIQSIDELNENISIIQEELNGLINDLNNLEGELTLSIVKGDGFKDEIKKIETALYKSIYKKLPGYYYTLEKNLLSEGKCLICNSKSNNLKIEAIRKKNNNECFICASKISEVEEFASTDIERLNDLNQKKVSQENIIQNLTKRFEELQEKITSIKKQQNSRREKVEILQRELLIIDNELEHRNKDEKTDTYTEILKRKEAEVEKLDQDSKNAYARRDLYKDDLKNYTKKFRNLISLLTNDLTNYFNKYASIFIGLDCELTVTERVIRSIPHIVYTPKIANQIRKDIWSVSESQRFFLDQAFRMAIIDYLQKNVCDFSTFFITETPEGSLDLAYENQVAEMFYIFAQSHNKIIFTSNLNSSNFLIDIFTRIAKEDRKSRILNLLEKGNLTRVQNNSLQQLCDILEKITEA